MASSFPLDFRNFELEITNRCNLGCPRCDRTEFIQLMPKAWKNHDLDLEAFKTFIQPIIDDIEIFEFKGSQGDPIFHPNFIEWIRWCKDIGKKVYIHTNGQAGDKLWISLATLLDANDKVVVGIDGMPHDFMKYRVNANWKNIERCAKHLAKKVNLIWQFIVFSFNEHEIEAARSLSNDLGFDKFLLVNSNRWLSDEDWLKPKNAEPRPKDDAANIDPQCLKRPMHIITADGYYQPCCMLIAHRYRYKSPWAKAFSVQDSNINDVIRSNTAVEFFAKLTDEFAPFYCRFLCGKTDGK
jgi:pyruvate-formate lyase-activating enzyme